MKKAFTLAEVLITLAIIGIVAAMTIPTLISVNSQKAWDTSANVFERKLGEALSIMNTQQVLGNLGTTENFVNELSKHMKIIDTCSTPTECFSKEIKAGSEEEVVDMTKITLSKNLYSTADPDWGTNVMGVRFGNGVSALVAYNPQCKSDPFSNQTISVTASGVDNNGKKGSVGIGTNCLSILYDVNGYGGPNYYTTGTTKSDLRGINVSLKIKTCQQVGNYCISDFGEDYSPVDCSNSSSSDYQYCGPHPSGYENDYWAGAKKKCAEEGMSLLTASELNGFYLDHNEEEGVPTEGDFWSLTEGSPDYDEEDVYLQIYANHVAFYDDWINGSTKDYHARALCFGN